MVDYESCLKEMLAALKNEGFDFNLKEEQD